MSFHIPAHKNTRHPPGQVRYAPATPNSPSLGDKVEHIRTGARGIVIGVGVGSSFVNFGGKASPFTRVDNLELRLIAESPAPTFFPDFRVEYHGSVALLKCVSPEAAEWVSEHVPHATWWAGSIAIEPRYLEDVVAGIENDGLTVNL